MDCIFCKIAKGEIPSYKIYEDKNLIAFLDIKPFTKGHTLIIPKRHVNWVWDLSDDEYAGLMKKVKDLAIALKKAFTTEWVVEGIAGVDVPHAHVHVIPRQIGDGLGAFPSKVLEQKIAEEEMQEIADKIKKEMK